MTMLSSSYGIIINRAINPPGCVKGVVYRLNATENSYLKEQHIKIRIIPSASKDVSIKFSYQYIHILNHKYRLNGLKGSTKIQNRESLFK